MINRLVFILLLLSQNAVAYRMIGGDLFLGGALGAQVNVVRKHEGENQTPKGALPFIVHADYAIDENWGVNAAFSTQFSPGALGFSGTLGAKYWFSYFNAPYIPYVGIGMAPLYFTPIEQGNKEFKLGVPVDLGFQFFLLANLLMGIKLQMVPVILFGDQTPKTEFSVLGLMTVAFRL